jgi:hypothetical protein
MKLFDENSIYILQKVYEFVYANLCCFYDASECDGLCNIMQQEAVHVTH